MSKQLDPSDTTKSLSPGQVPDYSGVGGVFTAAALAIVVAIGGVHKYVLTPHKYETAGKFIPVFLNSPKAKTEACKTAVEAVQKSVKSPWQIGTPEEELRQARRSCDHYQMECELRAADNKSERAFTNSCAPRKLRDADASALAGLKKIPALVLAAADKAGCENATAAFAQQFETHRTKYQVELRDIRVSYDNVQLSCKGKAAQSALDKLDFHY